MLEEHLLAVSVRAATDGCTEHTTHVYTTVHHNNALRNDEMKITIRAGRPQVAARHLRASWRARGGGAAQKGLFLPYAMTLNLPLDFETPPPLNPLSPADDTDRPACGTDHVLGTKFNGKKIISTIRRPRFAHTRKGEGTDDRKRVRFNEKRRTLKSRGRGRGRMASDETIFTLFPIRFTRRVRKFVRAQTTGDHFENGVS